MIALCGGRSGATATLALVGLVTAAFASLLPALRIDSTMETIFPRDDPELGEYDVR